ncbi:hypothetical protein B0H13DRAFT_2378175 [Mycena leptocephala]|nr:hypothetical protein B0H13DRAFT_2378175 [Mycena leptocephala]
MSTHGVRQLRGTRLRVGMLRARWCAGLVPGQPVHKETCPVHLSIFVFTRDPSVSMAFIGPNFFCVRSIFTSFSARHSGWASSREFFSFHLISLASNAQLPPLLPSSRSSWSISLAFPFHYRFATIFDSARVAICILGRYETGWLVRGKRGGEEREVAAGARIPSHGILVLPASESARSDSLVCAPLVLPLPPLYRRTTPRRAYEDRCASSGLYDERGQNARHAYHHDCPARCDYEDDGHGRPHPDYEREDGYEREAGRASGLSSTAVLRAEALDESAVSPHRAAPRELERDVDVSSRSRSHPAPDDYCSRSDSYDRIMMTGIEIGIGIANRRTDGEEGRYARARTGGDGGTSEHGRCTTSGGGGGHEHERYGTSIRTPATGPPTAAMKCGSWSAMEKVSSRSRSYPAPDDHYSRSNSSEQSGYARVRTGGDGEKERKKERGKGKQLRAKDKQLRAKGSVREGGRGQG